MQATIDCVYSILMYMVTFNEIKNLSTIKVAYKKFSAAIIMKINSMFRAARMHSTIIELEVLSDAADKT